MTPGEEKRKNETLKKTVGKTSGFSLREVVREWMNKTPPDENTRGKRREGKTNDVPENNKRRAPQQQMTFPETTNDVPGRRERRERKRRRRKNHREPPSLRSNWVFADTHTQMHLQRQPYEGCHSSCARING